MRTLKTSVVTLTLLTVVAAASIASAVTLLVPASVAYSTFKNVVTGQPTESLVQIPFDCEMMGFNGEQHGLTCIAIFKGSASQKFTVYSNAVLQPGDKLTIYDTGNTCDIYKILEAIIDRAAPAAAEEVESWECLAFMPANQTVSASKNVVSGKPTASVVATAGLASWGFEGEQPGHTVHAIFQGGKPSDFSLYTDFPILPGDNLELIEIGAVEGYKVFYVIITE